MKRRTVIIGLATLGLSLLAFVALSYVGVIMTWQYLKAWSEPHELPTAKIPAEFRTITGQELPNKVDGLRAIFQGSMDPEIFVRFDTDAVGIEHVKRSFLIAGATSEHVVAAQLKQMRSLMFSSVPPMQEKLGICLFDQKSIESGLLIESPGLKHRYYSVFIDEKRGTVYIYAMLL
jgi:hypothetical protein